jgi:hypothetical protein
LGIEASVEVNCCGESLLNVLTHSDFSLFTLVRRKFYFTHFMASHLAQLSHHKSSDLFCIQMYFLVIFILLLRPCSVINEYLGWETLCFLFWSW